MYGKGITAFCSAGIALVPILVLRTKTACLRVLDMVTVFVQKGLPLKRMVTVETLTNVLKCLNLICVVLTLSASICPAHSSVCAMLAILALEKLDVPEFVSIVDQLVYFTHK